MQRSKKMPEETSGGGGLAFALKTLVALLIIAFLVIMGMINEEDGGNPIRSQTTASNEVALNGISYFLIGGKWYWFGFNREGPGEGVKKRVSGWGLKQTLNSKLKK